MPIAAYQSNVLICTQKHKHLHSSSHAHTYIQKSCHPNLNPIYHQTNGIFPWSRRWLACSLYASSEISEFSLALFPLCLLLSLPSHTPPSSSSSHHCAALNVLLFCIYLFVDFHLGEKGVKSQIYLGLIAGEGWQLRLWLRSVTEMSSLGLRKCCEGRYSAQGRRG